MVQQVNQTNVNSVKWGVNVLVGFIMQNDF